MKVSLDWLNDYIDIGRDAERTAERLTDLGFPCDGIEVQGDDTVLDIEVTSNRGDCLGHLGMARELSVATALPLRMPEVEVETSEQAAADLVRVSIEDTQACHRYTARVIQGVQVGPTPDWMRRRLEAIGVRSVSNVVDATNYALMETGQPPHAFDYKKVRGGEIVVRRARANETLVSIDGVDRKLTPEMLVIADGQGPVAIAGVMGGLPTEVGETTTDILLEDAYFDPVTVRSTSRRLALFSDSSYRFERIVDCDRVAWASLRTAQLIVQVAGGQMAQGIVDAYPQQRASRTVTLRRERLARVLGVEVPAERVLAILKALQFAPEVDGDNLHCAIPSWRSDVTREADLIEEVARCYGYDKIPTRPRISIEACPVDARQRRLQALGEQLNACGYYETITVDFVDGKLAGLFAGDTAGSLAVSDATRKDSNLLRQTLLGSLLGVLRTNLSAKTVPCRLFELANTFVPGSEGQAHRERTVVALVADGDFRQLRTAVEGAIRRIAQEAEIVFRPVDLPWAEAGAEIVVNGDVLGHAAVFSSDVCRHVQIKNACPVGAEFDLEAVEVLKKGETKLTPIPRFPSIERDLSLVVKESVCWDDILSAIASPAPDTLEGVQFVDIYRGKGIKGGHKSVTLSLAFRDADGTLKHETVDAYQTEIVQSLEQRLQAELRA